MKKQSEIMDLNVLNIVHALSAYTVDYCSLERISDQLSFDLVEALGDSGFLIQKRDWENKIIPIPCYMINNLIKEYSK